MVNILYILQLEIKQQKIMKHNGGILLKIEKIGLGSMIMFLLIKKRMENGKFSCFISLTLLQINLQIILLKKEKNEGNSDRFF